MDSFHHKCIFDITKIAERCVAGYETLYQRTKLSVEEMGDHSSDADDEITDLSGENLVSSPELCASSKQYYVLSGTKPFSLVIRRCSTPAKESDLALQNSNSGVSSPCTKECEETLESEFFNSDRKVSDASPHQRAIVNCNHINLNLEELGQTDSCRTVKSLQDGILNTSKENNSVVTQECIGNIICGNELHAEVCTIPSAENGVIFNNPDINALLSSEQLCESCSSDTKQLNCSLPLHCSREGYGRAKIDSIDNSNHYSSYPLDNPKNTQSVIHTFLSEHCKQEVKLSVSNNSFVEGKGEDGDAGITNSGECEEMKAVDIMKLYIKAPAGVMLDTESFQMKEHSDSTEKIDVINVQSEFVEGGKSNEKSNVIESLLSNVCEGNGTVVFDDISKYEKSELTVLEIQGENTSELVNTTEKCDDGRAVVSHDVDITMDRNSFHNKDHRLCVRKHNEHKNSDITLDVSIAAVQNDTGESEIQSDSACESLLVQELDYTCEEMKADVLKNSLVANAVRITSESIFLSSVGYEKCSAEGNAENREPTTHIQNKHTLPVKVDNFVEEHAECSYNDDGDEEEVSKTESDLCSTLSPENLVSSVHMNAILITDEVADHMAVNVRGAVIKSQLCKSVLTGDLVENVTEEGEDCHIDKFCTRNKANYLESRSSVCVQSYTEDAADSDAPSDTVHAGPSPLLFTADDDDYYCTETIQYEPEVPTVTSYYDAGIITVQNKLHRLQEALLGVPPPPSVTIPQHDVADILRLWKENKCLNISANAKNEADVGAVKSETGILKHSYLEQLKNFSWPESKYCCYYGIYYNFGRISEEFEILCQKLRDRYVGSETTSSCSIWFQCDISKKVHSVNSRRRSTGHSPGSRLSHLARRRRTFSSANLLNSSVVGQGSGSHHSAAERRLIMVDQKKTERRQRSKSYQPHKQVPSVDRNRLQQTKRALFKSPPSNLKRIFAKSRSGSKTTTSDIDRIRIENSKRALWPYPSKYNVAMSTRSDRVQTNLSGEVNVFRKRKREEQAMLTPHNMCARRMLFGDAGALTGKSDLMTAGDNIQRHRTGENKLQILSVSRDVTGGLSGVHRKKLLWAVAEALRAEGISMSHPLFRPRATSLARLVCSVMPDLTCKRAFSTSDLMLQLTKQYVGDVMKQQQSELSILNSRT